MPATVTLGTQIAGRYALVRVIGEGAMGAVYEAENTWTGRRVAVKLLHADHAGREEFVARFMQEARIATRIAHPNIVDVLDMGRDADTDALYIVQELLRGEDLRTWLIRNERARPAQALEILTPVVAALAAAHARGVVHRDIKPENIFLAEGDAKAGTLTPKLIDFGISKVIAPDAKAMYRTAFGRALGTPEYMAPEQILGEREPDGTVDVWAAGVVLYELLAGHGPFDAPTTSAVIARVISDTVVPIDEVVPDVHPALVQLLARVLERDIEKRTQGAQDLLEGMIYAYEQLTSARRLSPDLRWTARRRPSSPRPEVHEEAPRSSPSIAPVPVVEPDPDEDPSSSMWSDDDEPEPTEVRSRPALLKAVTARQVRDTTLDARADLRAQESDAASRPVPLGDDEVLAVESRLAEGHLAEVVTAAEALIARAQGEGGELAGRLRAAQCVAYHWLGDAVQGSWCAGEALLFLTPGSGRWLDAIGHAALAFGARGDAESLIALSQELRNAWPVNAPVGPMLAVAAARLAGQLIAVGWPELAVELTDAVERGADQSVLAHPMVRAWQLRTKALGARTELNLSLAVSLTAHAIVAFEEASDPRNACVVRAELGDVRRALGDYAGAERVLTMASATATALGLDLTHSIKVSIALARVRTGDPQSAWVLASEALEVAERKGNRWLEMQARLASAGACVVLHAPEDAQERLDGVLGRPGLTPPHRIAARALQAAIFNEQKRHDEALTQAELALDQLNLVGSVEEAEFIAHVNYVIALRGCRHVDAARGAVREALALVDQRAAALTDPAMRAWFVTNVPEHRALRTLAQELGV